jgi:hypothetical protein
VQVAQPITETQTAPVTENVTQPEVQTTEIQVPETTQPEGINQTPVEESNPI